MKYCINNIIVVEGKEDASYLSSFIDAEYVTTNGYEIPVEEVDYLNEASKIYKTIVLFLFLEYQDQLEQLFYIFC